MNIVKGAVCTVLTGVSLLYGADAITGRVVTSTSAALAHARVWLKNNPAIVDSTGNDGTFSLSLESTATPLRSAHSTPRSSYQIHHNILTVTQPVSGHISLSVLDLKGTRVATIYNEEHSSGSWDLPLNSSVLPLASGSYLLECRTPYLTSQQMLYVAGTSFTSGATAATRHISSTTASKTAAGDTLIVLRMGHEIKKVYLSELAAKEVGDIKLSLRGYSIKETTPVKTRTIEVVIPSDYNELYALPVLYLMHGGGEDHTAWRIKGQLISALNGTDFPDREKMQAMIIVTPDAQSTAYGNYGRGADPFYTDLTVDIRGYIEKNYKVDTSRYARAVSGFSMGAMQTHNLTLFYPELFGYSYPICGGLYKCSGFSEAKLKADIASGTIDTTLVHSMKAYKLHSNETDIAWTDTRDFEKFLETIKIKHTYDFTSYSIGGHTFSYCNAVFKKYSTLLFK